ncbi:ATP-dependent RNA helicase DHX30-like, partial [Ostrinia furnacalis]|uniref:ATP-dependent RNA helicase DHX30-like n=1 Tax=Ostrinia furnacalis TaxID=93504 RepID=UPI00103A1A41
ITKTLYSSHEITSTLQNSRVLVIVGAAGCGKSTRAPAAILKSCGANMAAIVSEPRRVAAIGLAQRVASELGEEVGESIGYQVRLHSKPPRPPGGSILYCTSGVLLRRLQTNPGLQGCTHVIIDEAHERDVNTDITLLLLKKALNVNPDLKVVIMSATLDTEVFIKYFDSCPVIEVPGRTYPVEVSHLEDIQKKFGLNLRVTEENSKKVDGKPYVNCQELVEVIKAVDSNEPEGAILVFLPGWVEIKTTKKLLDEKYGNSTTHMILPVHSRLSTADQTKMFARPSPGIRKIVLSTNIAETSITIPDVVYVIDSGAHKENRIKEGTGTASLETVWVSQAAAKQRTGRAGRVQPGHCYRLYTKDKESDFAPHTTPEILRIPLEQTVLDCKTYAPEDKVADFLSQLPEPPGEKAIKFAVNDLIDLGALTKTEQLTKLGSIISTMTLHPRLATGLLQAAASGSVLAFANIATHCSDNVEVFRDAADRRDEIREIKSKFSATSDHSALHWIQYDFENTVNELGWKEADVWCEKHGLRRDRLNYVKSLSNLHLEQLLKSGFIEPNPDTEELTRFSDVEELSTAMLLSGADALLTTKRHVKTKGKLATVTELFTSKGDRAHIGSESVNYGIHKRTNNQSLLCFFGGQHSSERRALVVYKASRVPPHTVVLFGGGEIDEEIKVSKGNTFYHIAKKP